MAKKPNLNLLAEKVVAGDKEAAKDLMMAIPRDMAYTIEGGMKDPIGIAEDILAEEEPPPRVAEGVKGIEHPTRSESPYEYRTEGRTQVREAEARKIAEDISLLKNKSDMQDVLLKIAAEDAELAEQTARQLMAGGGALLGTAAALGPVKMLGASGGGGTDIIGGGMLGTLLGLGTLEGSLVGHGAGDILRPGPESRNRELKKEYDARERMQSIELSPEAQTIYDEYKAKGYSPTYYKTK